MAMVAARSSPADPLLEQWAAGGSTSSSSANPACEPASEVAFLRSFFNATKGKNWVTTGVGNSTWGGTGPPCQWMGVTCGNHSCVTAISLPSNGLGGSLSVNFYALPFLETLVLSNNAIKGYLPVALFTLDSIVTIDLSSNNFNGPVPSTVPFAYPPRLATLNLYGNRLSGTLPDSLSVADSLVTLKLYRNFINGTLPLLDGTPALQVLDLSYNAFSGPIPETYGALAALRVLNVSANALTGSIPANVGNMSLLEVLELSGNNLTGALPSSLTALSALTWLDLSANSLDGPLNALLGPQGTGAFAGLRYLSLAQNYLSGTIPVGFFAALSPAIGLFDLSYNLLTGTIPALPPASSMQYLASINLCCQNLVGPLPSFAGTAPHVNFVDVSGNALNGSLAPLVALVTKPIMLLNVASNNLTGSFAQLDPLFALQSQAVANLRVLYVGGNKIDSEVTTFVCGAANLILLDLSDNNLGGTVPDCMANMQYLKTVDFTGNIEMRGLLGPNNVPQLPPFLKKNSDVRLFDSETSSNFNCPQFVSTPPTDATFSIPPTYYDYSLCSCNPGFYGVGNRCVACARVLSCGGGTVFGVPQGAWLSPNPFAENAGVLMCRNSSLLQSACQAITVNVSEPRAYGVEGFPCARGYSGRLCSKCDDGYFPRGSQCVECTRAIRVLLPFGYVLLMVAVTYLCYHLAGEAASQRSIVTICLLYIQVAALYKNAVSIAWSESLLVMFQLFSPSNFELPAFSCLFRGETDQSFVIGAIVQPLVFGAAALLLMFVGLLWRIIAPSGSESVRARVSQWLRRSAYVLLFFLNLNYTNTARQVMLALSCSEDSITGKSFVIAYPYVQCHTVEHDRVVAGAYALVVGYLFGVPMLFTMLIMRNRHELKMPRMYTLLGFAYKCYKSHFYWWELVLFARRLVLTIVLFVPSHQSYISPVLTIAVFQLAILVQLQLRPYNTKSQNFVEVLGLYTLQGTYITGLIVQVPWIAAAGGEIVCMFVLVANVCVVLYFGFLLALGSHAFSARVRDLSMLVRRRRMRVSNYLSGVLGAPRSGVIQQDELEDPGGDMAERRPILLPNEVDAANFIAYPQRMPVGTNLFLA